MTSLEIFLLALALVESNCKDVPAYTGSATGYFQIKPIQVAEANRILEMEGFGPGFYTLEDRHDYWMSRSMASVFLRYWRPVFEKRYGIKWTPEHSLSLWHYGPTKWTPDSRKNSLDKERHRQYLVFRAAIARGEYDDLWARLHREAEGRTGKQGKDR